MDHRESPDQPKPDSSAEGEARVCPVCGASFPSDRVECPHDGALLETVARVPAPEPPAPADLAPPLPQEVPPTAILSARDGPLPPPVAISASPPGADGPEEDPLVGQLLRGKWRVLSRVGAGGFGTVYKVRDEKGGWIEALKILGVDRLTGVDAENARKRFLREARIMKDLSKESPHIVGLSTYEEDLEAGLIYFLMEYVEGENLAAVLRREGPLPPQRVASLALQVCDALMVAHEGPEAVVHRDLKLENLMLTRDRAGKEVVKVLDFGIAKLAAQEADSRLTSVGTSLGTPGYAAPEQLRAGDVDARTDLFAFGVILYSLLTGRDPWLGHPAGVATDQIYELMVASDRAEVRPMTGEAVQVPPSLEGVVLRLLRRDPAERFQSARELKEAFLRLDSGWHEAEVGPVAVSAQTPDQGVRPRGPAWEGEEASVPRRRGTLLGVGVGGAVLLAALGLIRPWGRTLSLDDLQARVAKREVPRAFLTEDGIQGSLTVLGFLPAPFRTYVPGEGLPGLVRELRAAGTSLNTWGRVAPLLEAAVQAQQDLRYYGHAGQDVRGYAEEILALEPENPEARSLLRKVGERMAWDAEAALQRGEAGEAQVLIRQCLALVPDHPRCREVRGEGSS